ncbi:YczE/YyaS/YitT family protein [Conservatibacter flavescens]|uniref:YitT family protein n=1 Tax=Conservatibacter flavescens TaxID=28161 RepID=A0A2M8S3M1_9PAST|nr:hypothetical protein [Conservatibacter flavescens]PJG85755.1 hypothetical protein CVP05_04215 [Conservatibacter flavescens]
MTAKQGVLPQTKWTAAHQWSLEWNSLQMLLFSLCLAGFGDGLLVLANLGSSPWTVLSQGISVQTGMSIGWASFLISVIVMLLWFPLRLKVGLGTILNIILIAFALGLTVAFLPAPTTYWGKGTYILCGLIAFGVGTALYLTCHMGAGPRDGLMVGLCHRFQLKVGIVRTSLEVLVCLLGYLLGGTVGISTLIFALCIGWIVEIVLRVIKL